MALTISPTFLSNNLAPLDAALPRTSGATGFPTATFKIPEPTTFQPAPTGASAVTTVGEPTTYGHLVQQMVRDVNSVQQTAGEKVRDVLQGGPTSVHEAMIAVEESNVSFMMLSEMRNKLVESYQEVMRMQV